MTFFYRKAWNNLSEVLDGWTFQIAVCKRQWFILKSIYADIFTYNRSKFFSEKLVRLCNHFVNCFLISGNFSRVSCFNLHTPFVSLALGELSNLCLLSFIRTHQLSLSSREWNTLATEKCPFPHLRGQSHTGKLSHIALQNMKKYFEAITQASTSLAIYP